MANRDKKIIVPRKSGRLIYINSLRSLAWPRGSLFLMVLPTMDRIVRLISLHYVVLSMQQLGQDDRADRAFARFSSVAALGHETL